MSNLLNFFTGTLLENVRVRYIKRCCCFAVEEVLKIDLHSQERASCSKSAVGLFLFREASHIDFFHEKRHMDVGGGGCRL